MGIHTGTRAARAAEYLERPTGTMATLQPHGASLTACWKICGHALPYICWQHWLLESGGHSSCSSREGRRRVAATACRRRNCQRTRGGDVCVTEECGTEEYLCAYANSHCTYTIANHSTGERAMFAGIQSAGPAS